MARAGSPVHAAGAVVWRMRGEQLEVLLIHRPSYDDWSWPKGKLHKHESLPAAAVREVKEETGVEVVLGVPLPRVRYRLGNGTPKVCWYWAATAALESETALTPRPQAQLCSPAEVDEARWVEAVQALEMLTRRADRAPLMDLLDLHADGALDTWTLLLTRHGRAKQRKAWEGEEVTRPLTRTGMDQARSLIPLFSAFGAGQVVSSPWTRCALTVLPYAESAGILVAYADGVGELIGTILGVRQTATVVCTHRPVIPAAIATIATRTPRSLQARLPAQDPYLRTAEVLIVHLARPLRRNPEKTGRKKPRVVAVEVHRGHA